jgi:hypothetical protein
VQEDDAVDELTSPQGSLALALAALLLVVGFRLAHPSRGREWGALVAYAVAVVAQTLGARGILPGAVVAAVVPMRILGAILLVVGLIMVGSPARARRRAAAAGASGTERAPTAGRLDPVYAGLAVVLLGLLVREPSAAGAIAAGVAAPFLAWPALTSRGAPGRA